MCSVSFQYPETISRPSTFIHVRLKPIPSSIPIILDHPQPKSIIRFLQTVGVSPSPRRPSIGVSPICTILQLIYHLFLLQLDEISSGPSPNPTPNPNVLPMASSDDDFPLICDTTTTTTHQTNPDFHHQLTENSHFLPSQTTPLNAPPPPRPVQEANGEGYSNGGFCSQPMVAVLYENESDPNRSRINGARSEKWSDREELSDGGTPYSYNKKARITSSSSGGEYRKDRE